MHENKRYNFLTISEDKMKNKGLRYIQILTIIIFVSVLHFSGLAQTPKYFIITGKILSGSEFLRNSSVQIIKNNKPAIVSRISSNGRFRLELDYNAEYQLTFMQNGHSEKTIVVNTEIPSEVFQRENNFPHFLMAVMLDKTCYETDQTHIESPALQINYSSLNDNFVRVSNIFDVEYAQGSNLINKKSGPSSDSKSRPQNYHIF